MAHREPVRVTVGVDTHKHLHVAAARDQLGRRLGVTIAPASRAGSGELLAWARGLGEIQAWGVEGTGSYGAGLVRFLAAHRQRVLEINRTVQAGEATGIPKAQDGTVEMTRALRVARQTAVKARTQAVNAIKALLVTAPVELRERLDGLPTTRLVGQAAAWTPARWLPRRQHACWPCAAWPRATSSWAPRSSC
jgi:transposase